jgi:tRNA threonylcarbamoyladenosine biosynthesis protein TsaE
VAPITTKHSFELVAHSPAQTFRVGEWLGRLLQVGDVICLQGDLGSGKTCLTQGIGAGLGVVGTISSPTFVLINEYRPRGEGLRLYHVDLYRIEDAASASNLGLEDYLYGDGVTVIEWAERAREIMPPERLWIKMSYLDYSKRSLLFEAAGKHYAEILAALRATLLAGNAQRSAREEPRSEHAAGD